MGNFCQSQGFFIYSVECVVLPFLIIRTCIFPGAVGVITENIFHRNIIALRHRNA